MSAKTVVLTVSCLLYAVVMSAQKPGQPSWLDNAVFYQIYPSSFQDSGGNGIGGNAASYTYRQKRQGDIITIPAASALILEY